MTELNWEQLWGERDPDAWLRDEGGPFDEEIKVRQPSPRYLGPTTVELRHTASFSVTPVWQLRGRPEDLGFWKLFRVEGASCVVVTEDSGEDGSPWTTLATNELGLKAQRIRVISADSEGGLSAPRHEESLANWENALLQVLVSPSASGAPSGAGAERVVLPMTDLASSFALSIEEVQAVLKRLHGRQGLLAFCKSQSLVISAMALGRCLSVGQLLPPDLPLPLAFLLMQEGVAMMLGPKTVLIPLIRTSCEETTLPNSRENVDLYERELSFPGPRPLVDRLLFIAFKVLLNGLACNHLPETQMAN